MSTNKFIFLSYARKDGSHHAQNLIAKLEKDGVGVWQDKKDLDVYKFFDAEIENAIMEATSVVVCVTPDVSRADSFVRLEVNFALDLNKPIIPLVFGSTRRPITLMNLTFIDFSDWDNGYPQLIQRLQELISDDMPLQLPHKETTHLSQIPEISALYGRAIIIDELSQQLINEERQMIMVVGLGGIGKTSLCVQIVDKVKNQFESILWVALNNVTTLEEIFRDIILFLTDHRIGEVPNELPAMMQLTANLVQQASCLIVFDNFETVLQLQKSNVDEDIVPFFEKMAQNISSSKSAILVTTREIPAVWRRLEISNNRVSSVILEGIPMEDAVEILKEEAFDRYNDIELMQAFVKRYGGHPLAIRLALSYIKSLFSSDLSMFLESGIVIDNMDDLLEQHFQHNTDTEQAILLWLCIERQPLSFKQLQDNMTKAISLKTVIDAVESLIRKSLVVKVEEGFSVHPVIMEFMIQKYIRKLVTEFREEVTDWLDEFVLIKSHTKEYIRDTQVEHILQPLMTELKENLSEGDLSRHLHNMLDNLRQSASDRGYAATNILTIILNLGWTIQDFDFSHLRFRQAYLVNASLKKVDFTHAHFQECVFRESFGIILDVVFSPDGQHVAGGTDNGQVRVWLADTREQYLICEGHRSWVYAIGYTNDGRYILSGGEDQTVRVWDAESGVEVRTLIGHTTRVRAVTASSNGDFIVSAGEDAIIRVWDIHSGRCLHQLEHTSRIRGLAFVPNSMILLAIDATHDLKIWDVASGECQKTISYRDEHLRNIAVSPNGLWYAGVGERGEICLWSLETHELIRRFDGANHDKELVRCVAFSPDNDCLATAGNDHHIKVWKIADGKPIQTIQGHLNWLRAIAYSPDGNFVASGGDDQTIRLWDIRTGREAWRVTGYNAPIWAAVFHPSQAMFASGGDDQIVSVWDANSWTLKHQFVGHSNRIHRLAFHPELPYLASGGDDGRVRIWDVNNAKCLRILEGNRAQVYSLNFSKDGRYLAVGGDDPTIRIFDISGNIYRLLKGHSGRVWTLGFSSDDSLLISAGDDKTIRLWDMDSGECLAVLEGHTSPIWRIAIAQDDSYVVSGAEDNNVCLWDVKTKELIKTLHHHSASVRCVDIHPEGRIIASAGDDASIVLYDTLNERVIHRLQGHQAPVYPISFSSGGELLLSGSEDQTIKVWDVERGELVRTLPSNAPYQAMNISNVSGLSRAELTTLLDLGAVDSSAS